MSKSGRELLNRGPIKWLHLYPSQDYLNEVSKLNDE